jgi:hypothetical protein
MNNFSLPTPPGLSRRITAAAKLLALLCFAAAVHSLYGQAEPTATRSGSLQVGGTFDLANSDYAPNQIYGAGFYTSFDFRYHLGITGEFHQVNDSNPTQNIYERTYEIGPRYVLHFRRFQPYVQALYGRGVFNFPSISTPAGPLSANIAYNLVAGGVGVDYRLRRSINLRAQFEYQDWFGFPPNGLNPSLLSFGAAYHFH